MALNIETKQNHPLAVAQMQKYGQRYFLTAEEVNQIVAAIKSLQTKEFKLSWKRDNWD